MFKSATSSIFRRNVSWQLLGTATSAVFSGLVLLVMGRNLGAEGFGIYSIIIGFVTVANLLMEPRMQDVTARLFWNLEAKAAVSKEHRLSFIDCLVFESLLKLLPCLSLIALSYWLARLAKLPADGQLLIIIAAAGNYFAKIGYGLSTGILRVLGRSDQFTFCGSGELLVRLIILLLLSTLTTLTVTACVITLSATLLISNLVQLALAVRHIGGVGQARSQWHARGMFTRLREHRRLLLSNVGLSAADLMNKDLDVSLLSPMVSASTIGVYKMAKNIALLTWRAVDPFYLALMPELSRRIQLGNFTSCRQLLRRSAAGLALLALGLTSSAYLGVYFLGDDILGADFASVPQIIIWMLLGVIVSAPLVWGHPLSVALNRGDLPFLGSLLGMVIGLAVFVPFVSLWGIQGAAISWTLSFLPHFVFTSTFSYRLLRRQIETEKPVQA
jgi:O-antigen/teichoic acid export membrane protein